MPKFNRKKFFDGVRAFLKADGKTLTQKRTDALEFLIGEFELTGWTIPQIAYALATIYHETAHTFEPIREFGPPSYFGKYEPGTRIGRNLGNTETGDGHRYKGRGYVQITGRANYRKFGIEDTPDQALHPSTAFGILKRGMTKGSFTGKKLSDYISDTGKDYKNARKIINGLDKASLIAGYAAKFEQILREAKTNSAAVPQETATQTTSQTTTQGLPSETPQPDFTEGERPTESKVTQEKGGTTVEISEKNEQDVNTPAKVQSPEPYQGIGFWAVIKRDLGAAFGGNLTMQGFSEYASKASGWPDWVVALISKIALVIAGFTIAYFIFRVVHFIWDGWKKNQKTKFEVDAATSTVRKDIQWQ